MARRSPVVRLVTSQRAGAPPATTAAKRAGPTITSPAPARTPALPGSPVVATATGRRLAHYNLQRILHASADLALPMQPLGLVWDLLGPGRLLGLVAPSSARTEGR